MTLGPRLVIPGTIFGSFFLAAFLWMATSGLTFAPPAVLAAVSPAQATPVPVEASEPAPAGDVINLQPEFVDANAVMMQPAPALASEDCPVSPAFPDSIRQWCSLIVYYANDRGLPHDLLAALIWQESGGDPQAFSHSGAVGLMQVMPRDGLAAEFMCKNGPCFANRPYADELRDPEFNIAYGTKLLAELVQKYGSHRDALKSYGPMDVGYYYADKVLGITQEYGRE